MKPQSIHRLILSLCAAIGLAWLPACSDDKAQEPPFDATPTFVSFNLNLNKSGLTRTRAEGDNWGDDYKDDEGYKFDNIVDQMSFRPVIYNVDEDGNITTKFVDITPLTLIPNGDEETETTLSFSFTGMIAADEANGISYDKLAGKETKYRLMVFANRYVGDDEEIDETMTFEFFGNQGKPGFNAVPMWGVKEFDFKNLKKGEALPIGDIPLLRAMAMVRVYLAPSNEFNSSYGASRDAVNLVSLSINRHQAQGYMAPNLWNVLTVTNDEDHKFASTKRIDASWTASQSPYTVMVGNTSSDGKPSMTIGDNAEEVYHSNPNINRECIVFYLPEVDNDNNSPLKLEIGYSVNGSAPRMSTFEFRDLNYLSQPATGAPITPGQTHYADGSSVPADVHWHIVRNHIYEYKITGVYDTDITVEAKVNDWIYHKASIDIED